MGALRTALMDTLQRDRGGTSRMSSWPAPLLGLNTRDNLANMLPGFARQLDNLYPNQGECVSRGGSGVTHYGIPLASNTSGMSGLHPYGNTKLFAGGSNGVYDVTPGTVLAIAAFAAGGLLNSMSVNFTNSAGGQYLWIATGNGLTAPYTFDGTAWGIAAITGVDATLAVAPWVFKRKIFFIETGTMNAWFLPTDSIQGAASKLPLGSIFKMGGQLVAGATWTNDGGDGPDDYCVFISSEGEVAVFGGIDPASSSSWELVGVYQCGRPPSRKCFAKYGGDLIILTQMGALPLSKITASDVSRPDIALTDNIRPTIQGLLKNISALQGDYRYCIMMYPAQNALIINIPPQGVNPGVQYVMNVVTGAWCRFTGMEMDSMAVWNGLAYWGSHTLLAGAAGYFWNEDVTADFTYNGVVNSISYTAKTAYQRFGSPNLKRLPLLRPQLAYSGSISLGMAIATDYSDVNSPTGYGTINTSSFSFWDTAIWDISLWSAEFQRINNWLAVPHTVGYAHSLLLQVISSQSIITWSGTDVMVAGAGVRG